MVHIGEGALGLGSGSAGRGAWLCRESPGCVELADKHRSFSKALRHPITPDAIDKLRGELRAWSASEPTPR